MAAIDFVDGNGWISDDSDFYGMRIHCCKARHVR